MALETAMDLLARVAENNVRLAQLADMDSSTVSQPNNNFLSLSKSFDSDQRLTLAGSSRTQKQPAALVAGKPNARPMSTDSPKVKVFCTDLYAACGGDDSQSFDDQRDEEADMLQAQADETGTRGRSSGVESAKEKNRKAQRRFRERQKARITDLQSNNKHLGEEVFKLKQQVQALSEENRILRLKLKLHGFDPDD